MQSFANTECQNAECHIADKMTIEEVSVDQMTLDGMLCCHNFLYYLTKVEVFFQKSFISLDQILFSHL
jgi:hypothetical protein